jgi:hypothetical protein
MSNGEKTFYRRQRTVEEFVCKNIPTLCNMVNALFGDTYPDDATNDGLDNEIADILSKVTLGDRKVGSKATPQYGEKAMAVFEWLDSEWITSGGMMDNKKRILPKVLYPPAWLDLSACSFAKYVWMWRKKNQ